MMCHHLTDPTACDAGSTTSARLVHVAASDSDQMGHQGDGSTRVVAVATVSTTAFIGLT